MIQKKKKFRLLMITVSALLLSVIAYAQNVSDYMPDPGTAEEGMTLWQVILSGGEVMVLLGIISLFAVGLIVYYYLSIKPDVMLPEAFADKVTSLLENGKVEEARILCEGNENILSKVYLTGIKHISRDKHILKERIEDQARRQSDAVWQKLSYLADIAAISPMIGLLGTVLGMIQAFNVIAFQTGAVKPILLAGGISKAMVTTAAGLTIAIPAMIFHSYFRSKAYDVERRLEDRTTEFWHLLGERKQK